MSLRYYVIDVETNGLDASRHEITEISVIRCVDRVQLAKFIKIEHPERTSREALVATGRTMADLRKGLPAIEVINAVDEFLSQDGESSESRCMIAHNSSFDRRFVYALWKKYDKNFGATCWLDTKPAVKKYAQNYLGIEKPKLTLQASLNIIGMKPKGIAHSAISDTQNTYILHDHLVKQGFDFLPHIKRIPLVSETVNEEIEE